MGSNIGMSNGSKIKLICFENEGDGWMRRMQRLVWRNASPSKHRSMDIKVQQLSFAYVELCFSLCGETFFVHNDPFCYLDELWRTRDSPSG